MGDIATYERKRMTWQPVDARTLDMDDFSIHGYGMNDRRIEDMTQHGGIFRD